MKLRNIIDELEKRGLEVVNVYQGFSRRIIEVVGEAPTNLPVITEKRAGKTRIVRPAKLYGEIVIFTQG